jgi:pimeloyl-ACP methyl ester carboxylesterase
MLGKCFRRSEPSFEKLSVDVAKTDQRAPNGMTSTFDAGSMLDTFQLLPMPVVIIHGTEDPLMPLPNEDVWNYVTKDKENSVLPIPLPGVRHFPMLEDERFLRIVNEFLEAADISRIEVKERWRRRTR